MLNTCLRNFFLLGDVLERRESSRKKSQPKKKSSVDSKVDRKSSNPRKYSQKSSDNIVIKTSLTVRKNTEKVEKKVVPNGK